MLQDRYINKNLLALFPCTSRNGWSGTHSPSPPKCVGCQTIDSLKRPKHDDVIQSNLI